ncbi:hypothetical protein [Wocania ichthyoenteri]|uniref:hypothetical protein n=1 Tax=Wocania ichthyoenteri TaxID=1230531 RepID=UPI00053E4E49|nr:hypothetical protein [Wocania ichthyoenteri]
MKQTFLKTILLLFITIVFTNCDKEEITTEQQSNIETVSITEAQNLFSIDNFSKNSKSKKEHFAIPNLDFISHEKIIGSEELLTIIPAYTKYQNVYSRILLLKIDGSIESVIFSMVRDENSSTKQFSGKLYITDLDGNYINAFRVVDDVLVSRFLKPTSTESKSSKKLFSKDGDEEDCWGIACGMEGEEVVITVNKKPTTINFPLQIIYYQGGGGIPTGLSWSSGGGSGSTGCSEGYIKDGNGNCVLDDIPPSCKSFKFEKVGDNWQASLVQGIQFGIATYTVNPTNLTIYRIRDYINSPVLFETWINDRFGNKVSSGTAAEIAANALNEAIKTTAHHFKDKHGFSETQIRLWFEDKLKSEFQQQTDGGRITFRNNRYNQTPTDYKTTLFGSDNCN